MTYKIRPIKPEDNATVEHIIRSCLIEFGANREGTAWADPNLARFSEIYVGDGNKYWVAECENGNILGGVGIGRLHGTDNICELQKMYCLPVARGVGIAEKLLETALEYAKSYYTHCYLETLPNMIAAQRFYAKHGFIRTDKAPSVTEHFLCDVRFIMPLHKEN